MSDSQSSLQDRLSSDMKAAMRAKESERLGVIRLILAAIKQREVDERITLDDAQILIVLDKMAKQRRESISQFQAAGRQDLVDQEVYELELIQEYLPAALGEAEINSIIEAALADTGASSIKDMGKVMGIVKPKVQGRADMSQVSGLIKARLSDS
jgi:uncharacterized protein YqeY